MILINQKKKEGKLSFLLGFSPVLNFTWQRGFGQKMIVPLLQKYQIICIESWMKSKDWTINWTFSWLWHYYNWCRMAPNVICACTLRCDRLFLSADCFEVSPVRRIQNDTIFWWVPKLKLKPSSHLHNIPPHITHPDCEYVKEGMGQRDRREMFS